MFVSKNASLTCLELEWERQACNLDMSEEYMWQFCDAPVPL